MASTYEIQKFEYRELIAPYIHIVCVSVISSPKVLDLISDLHYLSHLHVLAYGCSVAMLLGPRL